MSIISFQLVLSRLTGYRDFMLGGSEDTYPVIFNTNPKLMFCFAVTVWRIYSSFEE